MSDWAALTLATQESRARKLCGLGPPAPSWIRSSGLENAVPAQGGPPRTLASRSKVRLVRASAWRSRRWNSLGDMMAGEKKRRHRKLVTATNGTFWRVQRALGSSPGPHAAALPVPPSAPAWWRAERTPRAVRPGSALGRAGRVGGRWHGSRWGRCEPSGRAQPAASLGGLAESVRSAPTPRPRWAGDAARSTCSRTRGGEGRSR